MDEQQDNLSTATETDLETPVLEEGGVPPVPDDGSVPPGTDEGGVPPGTDDTGIPPPDELDDVLSMADGEEAQRGTSKRHQQVSGVLTQMARVARSFLLYDPRNKAIHHFLTSLLDNLVSCLKDGAIKLMVQPFELWYEGEVVYLNRDRERSLAFRFYRDGVRGLHFLPGFHWEELAKLLEILSIRYTGVHQHEDDVVTLLWKANFKNLEIVAVEGFVPEDEEEDEEEDLRALSLRFDAEAGGPGKRVGGGPGADPEAAPLPDDVDLPPPHLPKKVKPDWVDVPVHIKARYRSEVSAAALPSDCLRLVRHMRRQLDDPQERWKYGDIAHLFKEIREFLLVSEHLGPLQRFMDIVAEMAKAEPPPWDQTRRMALDDLLRGCGDDHAVRKLLHSIPVEERQLDPELLAVIKRACADPFNAVLDGLAKEHGSASRAIGRQMLEELGKERVEELQQRFDAVEGHVARDLLRVIARIGGEQAAPFVARQCSHEDIEIQGEAMRHLKAMPYSGQVGRAIFEAFKTAESERRTALLDIMKHTGDRRFVDNLARLLEKQGSSISSSDAVQIGRLMGQLGGERYLEQWQAWLTPKGWIRKHLGGSAAQQIAAAVALSEIPVELAEKTLRGALKVADTAVQPFIGRALSHHRSAGAGKEAS